MHINGIVSANRYFFKMNIILFSAVQKNTLTEREVNTFWKKHTNCKWASFDNFVTDESKIWFMKVNQTNCKLGTENHTYV